jgi:hypothetical protein
MQKGRPRIDAAAAGAMSDILADKATDGKNAGSSRERGDPENAECA